MRTGRQALGPITLAAVLAVSCGRDPLDPDLIPGGASGRDDQGSGSAAGSDPPAAGGPAGPAADAGAPGASVPSAAPPDAAPGLARDGAIPPPPPGPRPADAAILPPPGPPPLPPPALDAGPAFQPDAPPAAPTCSWPSCLASLMAACTPSGMCTQQRTQSTNNLCYGNGVKIFTMTMGGGRGMPPVTAGRANRPDGSICYTFEARTSFGGGGGGITIVYQNAGGVQVATGMLVQGGQLSITCPGAPPQTVPIACQPGLSGGGGGGGGGGTMSGCVAGMCM